MGFLSPKVQTPPQLANPAAAAAERAAPPVPTPVDPVVQKVRAEEKIKQAKRTGIAGTVKTGGRGPRNPAVTTIRALGESSTPIGTLLS
jgi:hypothetical protein